MTRPSSFLDKKMLKAGRKIVTKEGSGELSIPKICSMAKANLGMFNYHFGTKDNYIKILYSGFKDEVTKFLGIEEMHDKTPLEKIKLSMNKIESYINKNPKLANSLFFDGLVNGSKSFEYVEKGIIPKFDHLLALIDEAKEQGELKRDIPTSEIFGCLVFGVIAPEIFKGHIHDTERVYQCAQPSAKDFSMKQRLDVVLKGFLTETAVA